MACALRNLLPLQAIELTLGYIYFDSLETEMPGTSPEYMFHSSQGESPEPLNPFKWMQIESPKP